MRARMYLVAAALPVLLASPAEAGGPVGIGLLGLTLSCAGSSSTVTQCAYQGVRGDNNLAVTQQTTATSTRRHHSLQLAITLQDGNGNTAFTGQLGKNQVALTVQEGNDNEAFTYQEGKNQASITVQNGTGQWAATSSIGDNTLTAVVMSNY
jgi:hypothetical protein